MEKLKEALCSVQPSSEISGLLDTLEEKIGGLYAKGETGAETQPLNVKKPQGRSSGVLWQNAESVVRENLLKRWRDRFVVQPKVQIK